MSCVAFLFWHIVADVLIFWMAFLVADGVALLFVRGGALFLLNGCTVLFGHLPALLAVDCRAHL